MKTRFRELCSFHISHEYYGSDTNCTDFDFQIAEHSQQALAGCKLLPRLRDGALHILFETDDEGLPIQDIGKLEILIGLRLRNPYFDYITDLPPATVQLYRNFSSAEALGDGQAADLTSRRFNVPQLVEQRPFTVLIRHTSTDAMQLATTVTESDDLPVIAMSDWAPGCYTIEQSNATEKISRCLILAPDLAGSWGCVCLTISSDLLKLPSSTPAFSLNFKARNDTLEYFVVAPKDWGDLNSLNVVDRTSGVDKTPAAKISFSRVPLSADSQSGIAPEILGLRQQQAVLFRSPPDSIVRHAAAIHRFQLERNGDPLIKNLPLPGATSPSSRFIVQLSKP